MRLNSQNAARMTKQISFTADDYGEQKFPKNSNNTHTSVSVVSGEGGSVNISIEGAPKTKKEHTKNEIVQNTEMLIQTDMINNQKEKNDKFK